MSSVENRPKLNLPKISGVELNHFDIYTYENNPKVKIDASVFCLIGANGLGKSTFLNAINFGITGAIPDAYRKFISAKQYYINASKEHRNNDYFSGRVSEPFRDLAKISVELTWPDTTLTVTRDVFNDGQITGLKISTPHSNWDSEEVECSPSDLEDKYKNKILEITKLESFEQFVFFMHFVATFDEGRHLLLWDDAALTNVMYLAFGAGPNMAKLTDELQKKMNQESSRARNITFSARHVSDQITNLLNISNNTDDSSSILSAEELKKAHENLNNEHQASENLVRRKQSELQDADLRWAELSASLTEQQMEYSRLFSERIQGANLLKHHQVIQDSIKNDLCSVCGTHHISQVIAKKIENNQCPICDTYVDQQPEVDSIVEQLKDIDVKISSLKSEINNVIMERRRLSSELKSAETTAADSLKALHNFENENSNHMSKIGAFGDVLAIKRAIANLELQRDEFLKKSREHYALRDKCRQELLVHEKQLKENYLAASSVFVPRFRELAEEFIGLPIDVELEHRKGANVSGFGLRLRMNDKLRLTSDKLSESQRFFMDIALRMALTEFISGSNSTLLIDTPEGSLDIAYEARAGAMFSKFTERGNSILMTANLRSSFLVLRLAELKSSSEMQIVRMTDWTQLSTVQQSEEKLFTKAYNEIEQTLSKRN